MKDLKAQLQALKADKSPLSPSREWVEDTRARVLMRAEQDAARFAAQKEEKNTIESIHENVRMLLPTRAFLVARTMVVLFLVVGLAVSGWLTGVSAAHKSLPGDLLYGVKLASEKTQKVVAKVAGDEEDRVKLALKTAQRRSDEIKQIAKNKPKEVPKASQRLKESLAEAKEEINQVKEKDATKAAALAIDVTENTERITDNLKEVTKEVVKKDIPTENQEETSTPEVEEVTPEEQEQKDKETKEAVEDLVETVKAVDEVELEAIEVVLQVDPEEVKEFVEKKTQKLLEEAADNLAEVEDIKDEVEEAVAESEEVEEGETQEGNSEEQQVENASEDTQESAEVNAEPAEEYPAEDVTTVVEVVKEEVTKGAEEIEKGLEETKTLIDSGQLQEALEKLKVLTSIQGEAEKSLVSARGKVDELTPKAEPVQEETPGEELQEAKEDVTDEESATSTKVGVSTSSEDIVSNDEDRQTSSSTEDISQTEE